MTLLEIFPSLRGAMTPRMDPALWPISTRHDHSGRVCIGDVSLEGANNGVIFTVTAKADTPELAREMADAGIRATSLAANELETMTVSGESSGDTVVKIVPVELALTPTSPVSPP